jgi:hypothetical protein
MVGREESGRLHPRAGGPSLGVVEFEEKVRGGCKMFGSTRQEKRVIVIPVLLLAVLAAALGTARAGEQDRPTNFGMIWNQYWNKTNREAYLLGYRDAAERVLITCCGVEAPGGRFSPPKKCEQEQFRFPVDALEPVVTALYADPANTFISHSNMVFFAQRKLDGEDIEHFLRSARATAIPR